MTRGSAVLLAVSLLPGALPAQAVNPGLSGTEQSTPPIVRYGKWGAAALFAGLTFMGVSEHGKANSAFRRLQSFCRTSGQCAIGPDGRYANPAAESRYQTVVSSDRAARGWLISGQVALAGAAVLFIVELMEERGTPNIPFQGLLIEPGPKTTRVGWSFSFGSP